VNVPSYEIYVNVLNISKIAKVWVGSVRFF